MKKVFLIMGVLAMVILIGCSDDSTKPEIETPDPLPETPSLLVQGFLASLGNESIAELDHILHENFQFKILQSTRDNWDGSDHPLDVEFFDRAAMLEVHTNFFTEVEGMNESGQTLSYVDTITIPVFSLDGTWAPILESDDLFSEYPDAHHAMYNVLINFNNPDLHRWQASETLDLVALQVTVDGVEGWQLLNIRGFEMAGIIATDSVSYDSVMSLYRF